MAAACRPRPAWRSRVSRWCRRRDASHRHRGRAQNVRARRVRRAHRAARARAAPGTCLQPRRQVRIRQTERRGSSLDRLHRGGSGLLLLRARVLRAARDLIARARAAGRRCGCVARRGRLAAREARREVEREVACQSKLCVRNAAAALRVAPRRRCWRRRRRAAHVARRSLRGDAAERQPRRSGDTTCWREPAREPREYSTARAAARATPRRARTLRLLTGVRHAACDTRTRRASSGKPASSRLSERGGRRCSPLRARASARRASTRGPSRPPRRAQSAAVARRRCTEPHRPRNVLGRDGELKSRKRGSPVS
jgi:hypothetical protein